VRSCVHADARAARVARVQGRAHSVHCASGDCASQAINRCLAPRPARCPCNGLVTRACSRTGAASLAGSA
jgi:hypothetical protein